MRVMSQMAMVMNLDKCIGCHTCSVTCKQAWTNRSGVEYVWFNNVETRPGQGYPRTYQDQERWKGGWSLNKRGRLTLRAGGRVRKLLTIFSSPTMPSIDDYYEPWTYDYETLIDGISGLEKMLSSFLMRPPALRVRRPRLFRAQPPRQRSWSW